MRNSIIALLLVLFVLMMIKPSPVKNLTEHNYTGTPIILQLASETNAV